MSAADYFVGLGTGLISSGVVYILWDRIADGWKRGMREIALLRAREIQPPRGVPPRVVLRDDRGRFQARTTAMHAALRRDVDAGRAK